MSLCLFIFAAVLPVPGHSALWLLRVLLSLSPISPGVGITEALYILQGSVFLFKPILSLAIPQPITLASTTK